MNDSRDLTKKDHLPVASDDAQVLPPGTPDYRGLTALTEAARPLIGDFLRAKKEEAEAEQQHEFRMAEHDARVLDRTERRLFPLLWFFVLFVAGLIALAAYKGQWMIATHLLTALLGAAGGYSVGFNRYRRLEAEPAED